MQAIVLGSAAGGGVPQWNCACDNCQAARRNDRVQRRTQDSIAVSADGDRWFLLNASPDVARQIEATPALWPGARRHSPIAGVILTNGDIDHCLGLLSLREWTPLSLYATAPTRAGLFDHNVLLRTLNRQQPHVIHRPLACTDEATALLDSDNHPSGLAVRAFAVAGKAPLHLEGRIEPSVELGGFAELNVGLAIEEVQTGARLVYVPGAGSLEGLAPTLEGADCLLFDGTFWADDELSAMGQSSRSARAMAHLPVGGPHGSLAQLSRLSIRRTIYTHINNTNPMLDERSAERAELVSRGFELAHDGLELTL